MAVGVGRRRDGLNVNEVFLLVVLCLFSHFPVPGARFCNLACKLESLAGTV